jgi:hypothetical protein
MFHSFPNWVRYPATWVVTGVIEPLIVLVVYVLVHTGVWSDWSVPQDTHWFTVHLAILVFLAGVYGQHHASTGELHLTPKESAVYQVLVCVVLVVDFFTVGKQLSDAHYKAHNMSADAIGQFVLTLVVAVITFSRFVFTRTYGDSGVALSGSIHPGILKAR